MSKLFFIQRIGRLKNRFCPINERIFVRRRTSLVLVRLFSQRFSEGILRRRSVAALQITILIVMRKFSKM